MRGTHWKKPMAIILKKDFSTIKRWAAGEFFIPDDVFVNLIGPMELHIKSLTNLVKRIKK